MSGGFVTTSTAFCGMSGQDLPYGAVIVGRILTRRGVAGDPAHRLNHVPGLDTKPGNNPNAGEPVRPDCSSGTDFKRFPP